MAQNEWLSGEVPIVFLGYSFGGCLAYECARYLDTQPSPNMQRCHHLLMIAAPTRDDLQGITLFEADKESFSKSLVDNMGSIPSVFHSFIENNSTDVIHTVLLLGMQGMLTVSCYQFT